MISFFFLCHFRNPFNSAPTFPNQSQWNASGENEFDMTSTTSLVSGSTNPAPKVNNHQKTAERMAEDESKHKIYTFFFDKNFSSRFFYF